MLLTFIPQGYDDNRFICIHDDTLTIRLIPSWLKSIVLFYGDIYSSHILYQRFNVFIHGFSNQVLIYKCSQDGNALASKLRNGTKLPHWSN